MTSNLPKWIIERYAKLWQKFKHNPFYYEDALSVLNEKNALSVILSELRKSGWVEVKLDAQDTRKRIYILKDPEKAIKEIIKDLGKK